MKKISTTNAPAAIGPYSQGIISGNLIYTSGQIALIPETGEMLDANVQAQTKQLLENLKAVLEAAGSSLDHVIKTTCFLQNMSDFAAFNEVYAEYFPHKPARSCVAAAALPKNALVEVEAIAEVVSSH